MAYADARLTCVADHKIYKQWCLDTTDVVATVDTDNYITDAKTLGMSKGDLLYVRVWTTAIPASSAELQTDAATAAVLADAAFMVCMGINATGGADLSNETGIAVANAD